MNPIIGAGNKVSFDLSFKALMNSQYLKLSSTDYTYLRHEQLLERSRDVFIKLLCDVLLKNIMTIITNKTGREIPYFLANAKGELDDKDEYLNITFNLPDGISEEQVTTILKEEFKDEPSTNLTRRILRLF